MNPAVVLKENLAGIPPGIGKLINKVPFSYRPGLSKVYKKRILEIDRLSALTIKQKQQFVYERIFELVSYAIAHVPFYRSFYKDQHFSLSNLNRFEDIERIPIINKSILQQHSIEYRSSERKNRYIVNTGGSSGKPLSLYIEPDSMGHEWAHMHNIWSRLNYNPASFKLCFGGRSDVKDFVDYDVVRNSFNVDIYAGWASVAHKLYGIVKKHPIEYLHGYPSSIYEFARYCKNNDPKLVDELRKNLKGAFLGSEYPHSRYRKAIEEVFEIPTISWYGHTERAVLAHEEVGNPFTYKPFLTYGFAEAIATFKQKTSLVATSYYNYATPLIRYDTEDLIEEPIVESGILDSFKITQGRSGQFVIDGDGNKVNLTALIFGRHHQIFDHSEFIQVKQSVPGQLTIIYTSKKVLEQDARNLFDTSNINMSFSFTRVEEPIRTTSGKINLLVK
ncbi:hypothetical protein BST97_07015 [Nonlabens spongiae]|uniref:Phenylacetate-CoA ligase n=1 Tax=Nonlabens spongiae TaxID=331648 RepID=A0A1W6MJH8_9FLAO|nr:hypothetical protein [Nonlabens spongiae]ARN77768.1 hypothetical protein BST97_07015 [Nonlabens spongiae]